MTKVKMLVFSLGLLFIIGPTLISGSYRIETSLQLEFKVVDEPYGYNPSVVLYSPYGIGVTGRYTKSISFYDNNGTFLFYTDDSHTNMINTQLVIPKEDTYITRDLDGKIAFWDAKNALKKSEKFNLPKGYNYWNSESPMAISDNYCLAFNSNQASNRTLHVYDLIKNEYIFNYTSTYYAYNEIAISPDCTEIAYVQRNYPFNAVNGEQYNTFKIIDIINNQTIFSRDYEKNEAQFTSLIYSHSGSLFALMNYIKDNSNISDLVKYDVGATGLDRFNKIKTYSGYASFFIHPDYNLFGIYDYSDNAQFYFEDDNLFFDIFLGNDIDIIGFSADGQKLLATSLDSVHIYNFNFSDPAISTNSEATSTQLRSIEDKSSIDNTSTNLPSPFNFSLILLIPIIKMIYKKVR